MSRFGFKNGIFLLIALVSVHCFSITFIISPYHLLYIREGWEGKNYSTEFVDLVCAVVCRSVRVYQRKDFNKMQMQSCDRK